MFRIRRIYDDVLPVNRTAIVQARDILASQFDELPAAEVDSLADKLRNPFKQGFRSILFVAEGGRRRVQGFALLFHDPELASSVPPVSGRTWPWA